MASNEGLLKRIRNGVQVGLAAVKGAEVPTADRTADVLDTLAKDGLLENALWGNETVQKELLDIKNKLKIFRTSSDLYSFHSNIIRSVIGSVNDKNKQYKHGDPQRDFFLAEYWKNEPILAGAVYSMSAKMSTLSWELIGTKRLASYYADIYNGMLNMNGAGWGDGISATAQDFYTTDRGSFWITPRDGSHLTGRLQEIGVMDSLSCAMTGNWERPVLYSSYVTGQDLWLRHGEYAHFASMVSPREELFGMGYCAVSRAYRAARILMGLSDYDWEKLNNMPPEGVAAVSGLTHDEFMDSLEIWRAAREKNKSLTYPQVLWLLGSQPNTTVGIDFVGFSQIPEAFQRDKVIEQYVNTLALDFGVDSREFWPISTSSLGTAAESEIQHMKAKGKGPGEFIAVIERYLNNEQPDGVEFGFDTQDIGEDMAAASVAKAWVEAFLPLFTGGQQKGAASPNPMRGPGGSEKEPPGTMSVAKQEEPSDDKIITKDELLQLLVDRKVLPTWILNNDKRVVVTDIGVTEKELRHLDDNQPIRIRWKSEHGAGKFEYFRLPAYEIQSVSNSNVPEAINLQSNGQNGSSREFQPSNGSLGFKGGPGSGNFGHAGRKGKIGGSAPGKGNGVALFVESHVGLVKPINNLIKSQTDEYYKGLGYSDEEIAHVRNLMDRHGYGGEIQERADATIVGHINAQDRYGQLITDQVQLENELFDRYVKQQTVRHNNQLQKIRDDFDYEMENGGPYATVRTPGGLEWYRDNYNTDEAMLQDIISYYDKPQQYYLYRLGSTNKPVQSWTWHESGARMYGVDDKGIGWDNRIAIDDVRKNYHVLGGMSRLMGSPGEAEITLLSKDAVQVSTLKEINFIAILKQLADELVEDGLERNIHGNPLPAGESLRGPRVTRTAVQNELDKWRKHPVLQQYVPTLEESDEIQAILEKV